MAADYFAQKGPGKGKYKTTSSLESSSLTMVRGREGVSIVSKQGKHG